MTSDQPVLRHLGGDSSHRSFFGGTHSGARVTGVAVFLIVGMVITIYGGWPGIVVGGAGVVAVLLLTARTHRGTILERQRRRRRWHDRVSSGTDAFTPYDVAAWDQAEAALRAATSRRTRWAASRELAALRANPDGCDGMGWLEMGRLVPGVQWHAPLGEPSYLAVVFAVSGQLRGVESPARMARAAEAWGSFLASRAAPSSLVGGVQIMTRVLPATMALHEHWALQNLDPSAPAAAIRSYEEVLHRTGDGAMVQRHYVVVRWPIGGAFTHAAARYGEGTDGWRALMADEIAATMRGLRDARLGAVEVLSARQVLAVLRHQQNPSLPLDAARGVEPHHVGLASHDEVSAHVVDDHDPISGRPVQWWHRTARIGAEALVTAPRTQLWLLDLLIGRLPFIRSISFHLNLVPAGDAKAAAQRDLVRDEAEVVSRRKAGRVDLDDTTTAMSAAALRASDLRAGSGHHGADWTGYVTISAPTRDELARACRQLEETCSTGLGIEFLDWQDGYQSAASGTTWPIGRGLAASKEGLAARVYRLIAGRSEKEALS